MNAYVSKEELNLLPVDRISHKDHFSAARNLRRPAGGPLVRRIAAWVSRGLERRAVMAELHELSDRELADIGLGRSEISRVFDPSFVGRR